MARTAKEVREQTAKGKGSLGKAADDEPVFVLRAQDDLAADLIEQWSNQAHLLGCPWDKIREARLIAQDMREWPRRKNPD